MAITLVSTMPKSIPSSTAEAPADANVEDTENNFASMLLGQLAQAANIPPGKDLLSRETDGTDVSEEAATGEDGTPDDALALLATLGVSATSPVEASPSTPVVTPEIAAVASQASSTNATAISSQREALAAKQANSSQAESPVSFDEEIGTAVTEPADKKAATFAVPANISTDENASSKTQSANTSPSSPAMSSSHSAVATLASNHSANVNDTNTQSISTHLRAPHWNNDFAQKIVWLASNQKQAAELTLNPPNMGSIEVSLRIDNDQATATFVSTNADVRETIETALPRLREMFAGVGISLGQTNVSAESFKQAFGQGTEGQGTSRDTDDNAILAGIPRNMANSVRQLTTSGRGLVDLFA